MGETAERLLSVHEFLAWDDGADMRYQLLRGLVTMMAPPQAVHGALVARLASQLSSRLPRPCSSITEAGIKQPHRNDTYYQADLAVTSRPLERGEIYLQEPALVVEVLSPSTESTDRLLKLDDYRLIPSITDILFVSSMRVQVEHWHRQGDVWLVATRGPGERIELTSFAISIELDTLYADLPLAPELPETGPAPR